jgi:hypothetical protein
LLVVVMVVAAGCSEPRAIGNDPAPDSTRDDAAAGKGGGVQATGGAGGVDAAGAGGVPGTGGAVAMPMDASVVDVPAPPAGPICTGTQRVCGGQCIEGCCNDADCPPAAPRSAAVIR